MSLSQQQILDAISDMTVMEVVDLVSAMEEKFGVSAAAAVAAPVAADVDDGEQAEEQTEFTVVLASYGEKKIDVIKAVRALTGMQLKDAKKLVDDAPSTLNEAATKEEADEAKAALEEAGATVEVK
ncbi:MAG: 50S ribosomal protein L7/L12 [Pseudomonadales bacterium]|nr:50S ribosomal protein L7/L12 [Pseudomonadales bacterium]